MPGVRRQGEELRRRQGRRHEGRQEGRAGRRDRASRSSPTPGGRPRPRSTRCRSSGTKAPNAKVSSASIAEMAQGRARRRAGLRRQPERRRQGRHRQARPRRSRRSTPIPYQNHACMEPMNATALYTADKCEVWGPTQNGEAALRGGRGSVRPAGRQSATSTRSISAAASAGAARSTTTSRQAVLHRQADAGHAGEAALVARGGHGARPLPPGHAVQADRRLRRQQQPDRPAHAALGPVDPRRRASAERSQNGRDPLTFQGLSRTAREHAFGYSDPQPADRPRDAQPAHPAGVLARREHQPERHLHRMLHGRAGAGGRARTSSSSAAS